MRGRVISFLAAHKKKTLAEYRIAEPVTDHKQQWKDSKAKYDLCLSGYEKMKGDYARLKYHTIWKQSGEHAIQSHKRYT